MNLLSFLFMESAGVGLGIFIGVLIGFGMRKRRGKSDSLVAGSVVLTALAAGALAQVVMMLITYLGM